MSINILLLSLAIMFGGAAPSGRIAGFTEKRKITAMPVALIAVPIVALAVSQGIAVAAALGMVLGLGVVKVRARRRRRRQHLIASETAALLGSVVADLQSGASPHEAAGHLAHDPPPALAALCTVAAHRAESGASPATAFVDAPTDHPDLRTAGKLWLLAEARGIALAQMLGHMQQRIDARLRHARATEAALQGPQATAVILSLLPVAGILMGTAMGAAPIAFLTGGGLGSILLITGTALACGGFLWVDAIVARARAVGGPT